MRIFQRHYKYGFALCLSLIFCVPLLGFAEVNPSLHHCLKALRVQGIRQVRHTASVFWVVMTPQKIPGIQKHVSLEWPYRQNKSTRQIEPEVGRVLMGKESPDGSFVLILDENYRLWCWRLPSFEPEALHAPSEDYGKLMWYDDLPKDLKIVDLRFGDIESDSHPYVDVSSEDPESTQKFSRRYSLPHFSIDPRGK